MNVNEEIDKLLNDFTEQWAKDLEVSLFDALKKGGRGNPNPPDIEFKGGVVYGAGRVYLNIYANKDYWYYIENGRKKGKMPPTKALGEKWQAKNGINPANIIYDMTIEYNQKKGFQPLAYPHRSKLEFQWDSHGPSILQFEGIFADRHKLH